MTYYKYWMKKSYFLTFDGDSCRDRIASGPRVQEAQGPSLHFAWPLRYAYFLVGFAFVSVRRSYI